MSGAAAENGKPPGVDCPDRILGATNERLGVLVFAMNTNVLEKAPVATAAPAPANALHQEQQLVRRARAGEMDAYVELVCRYQERSYATIYPMTESHDEPNELAQDTLI